MSLEELFPDGDFRFHVTLRHVEPSEFYAPCDPSGTILAERKRWLESDAATYAAILPEGEAALREFAALAATWGAAITTRQSCPAGELLGTLGCGLEPDILFLTDDPNGQFRLRGGVLCFPTGWALREKLGHTLDFIHGVVPGLNAALGAPIQQFLSRLKPGSAFMRDNWGVAASAELNLHPSRNIAAPDLPVALERLWLRVEHQMLMALPKSRAIVFGIRIALHPLDTIKRGSHACALRRALATMPPEVIAYKRLERIHEHLLNVLE
jgi:dimethylamine monooxygenase subunit A